MKPEYGSLLFMFMGLVFDLMSLMALISTVLGKKSSGFLYVGFVLYICALVNEVLINGNLIPILIGLIIFHFLINLTNGRLNRRMK